MFYCKPFQDTSVLLNDKGLRHTWERERVPVFKGSRVEGQVKSISERHRGTEYIVYETGFE